MNVKLSRLLLVSSIYRSFVVFSESDAYKPCEWEPTSLADVLREQGQCSIDEWLDAMQDRNRREVQKAVWKLDPVVIGQLRVVPSKREDHESDFDCMARDDEVLELTGKPAGQGTYLQFRKFADWSDLKSTSARRKYLQECLTERSLGPWTGFPCAQLRSSVIEFWLTTAQTIPPNAFGGLKRDEPMSASQPDGRHHDE